MALGFKFDKKRYDDKADKALKPIIDDSKSIDRNNFVNLCIFNVMAEILVFDSEKGEYLQNEDAYIKTFEQTILKGTRVMMDALNQAFDNPGEFISFDDIVRDDPPMGILKL